MLRPQLRAARLVVDNCGGEGSQRLRPELVPVRQQPGRLPVDPQQRVRLQCGGRAVHLLRRAGDDPGEVGHLRDGGDPGALLLPVAGNHELVEVHREHASVGPERGRRETARGR